jgi:FMN phosphatase YigB (HAD superfamily)
MAFSWYEDVYLRSLATKLDQYEVVCFDVFNTLLFRACNEPGDVFAMVGKELQSHFKQWQYAPETYQSLRVEAEHRARSRRGAGEDCTFDEIFTEMPFAPEMTATMQKVESDCENRILYLNNSMHSFMKHCANNGKKIVIISDMYHSTAQILQFLEIAGVKTSLISNTYISSEHRCFKQSGRLFKRFLIEHPHIKPEKVLHIGDNIKADVDGAKAVGIHSVYYPVIEDTFSSLFSLERSVYDIRLGEIASLRKLAAVCNAPDDASLRFFHTFGAEIIGPLYALFADWVVSYAEKRDVSVILSFMREGSLLAKVISHAAHAGSVDVHCYPSSISRQPAYIASIFESNYTERISQTLSRGGRELKSTFDDIGLDINKSPFAQMSSTILSDLKQDGRIEQLEKYLMTPEIKESVLDFTTQQREYLVNYVDSLTGGKPALTVDIGIKGTTERFLNDIKSSCSWSQKLLHVLMMGSTDTNTVNIMNGIDIVSWLGIAGENGDLIGKLKYQILVVESFINDYCGSTMGYKQEEDKILPILDDEILSDSQKHMVKACWNGVETFQELWIMLSDQKPWIRGELLERKSDFLKIWLRFIEMPTQAEADMMGSFPYVDHFNSQFATTLMGRLPKQGLNDAEIRMYIANEMKNGTFWPQAAVVKVYPEYNISRLLENLNDISQEQIYEILRIVQRMGYKKGIIFCASELGRRFSEMADVFKIPLLCFVDSDKRLHGTVVNGLIVRSLDSITEQVDYYVIATYIYANEIRTILQSKYRAFINRPEFYDFGEKE